MTVVGTRRADPFRLAQFAGAQPLQRHQQHLLHEVARRMRIAQVAQAVEACAWGEPPIELRFRRGVDPRAGGRDAPSQTGIFERRDIIVPP